MARNQNRKYNLERLATLYREDRLVRQHQQSQRHKRDQEHGAGMAAGKAWASGHATPLLLDMLDSLYGKRISDVNFFYQLFVQRLSRARKQFLTFQEVFGAHLREGEAYSEGFLAGFVTGACTIRKEARSEAAAAGDGGSVAEAAAQQGAWKGWWRSGPNAPWIIVVEGATELETTEKLLQLHNGDKMALPAGRRPDETQLP